ncbi:DHH family phosphoesterase [Intestinibacillus massiliensis]|uniref:DHH family phosphoesterase n=1 Tax=Intestinibacillus massiliensis TaxID=1871029 RepID=UPI000B361274|nr:DHH family phosphoesterase [Intestinibacillus massiliensis]
MDKRLLKLIQPGFGLFFAVFLLFSLACAFFSILLSAAGVALCGALFWLYRIRNRYRKRQMSEYLEGLHIEVDGSERDTLSSFPIAAVVALATTGEILWCNPEFDGLTGQKDGALGARIHELAPGFDTRWLIEGKKQYPAELKMNGRFFQIYGNLIRGEQHAGMMMTLYFLDSTEFVTLRGQFESTRPAVSIISIDNYEELTKNATDSEKSAVLAEVDKKIGEWAKDSRALLRKYDRDKYIFVLEEADLQKLVDGKFSVLDEVRTIQSRDGIIATLSIGVGKDGETFEENYRYAGLALEMSLSRGGDQAVIKNKYAFEFFGGLSKEVEKRTKVKSRVVANALSQLIRDSSQVLVMGHAMSDTDSLGAAVGMVCAVRSREKPVHVVINGDRTLAGDLLHKMEAMQQYKGVFISPEEAMVVCDYNTLLIVVDTNRPDYVESPSLLESINKVAVIDHHRRAASYIEDSALNLHEPYASSTCELVAELLQYMVPNRTIMREEAECLLAGIYLDTKGFSIKAGVRTFEAAAYLKRAGADMVAVKKLFQSSFDEYMARQRIIAAARTCGEGVVVAISNTETSRAIAAQAADELLDIIGVRASIVAFPSGQDTIVSARSLGKVNVQIIMERLGGGGNLSSAGAQLVGVPLGEAEGRIMEAIRQYQEEFKKSS